MTLTLPPHFDPGQSANLWIERMPLLQAEALEHRSAQSIEPASSDERRVAAFGIDAQVTFCHPDGGLYVPGADADAGRAAGWLYRNLHRITEVVLSLDTHQIHSIFHADFWENEEGRPPPAFTSITASDVKAGRFRVSASAQQLGASDAFALEYCQRLEAGAKYVLTIWPYHGLLGGVGHALMPVVSEAAFFHGLVRKTNPHIVTKGRHPLTEMYSALSPEVTEVSGQRLGPLNRALFDHLMGFDEIYVFGQASSHCVLATLEDIAAALGHERSQLARFVLLEDCMSPVAPPPLDPLPPELNFPKLAQDRLGALVDQGMRWADSASTLR